VVLPPPPPPFPPEVGVAVAAVSVEVADEATCRAPRWSTSAKTTVMSAISAGIEGRCFGNVDVSQLANNYCVEATFWLSTAAKPRDRRSMETRFHRRRGW
jgi:hypothetical protein